MSDRGHSATAQVDKDLSTAVLETSGDDFPALHPSTRWRTTVALWLVLSTLLCGLGLLLYWRSAHALPQVHYETAAVERGSIAARVTATGSLSALLTVQVGSQVSGRVRQLLVDFNSPVKKGETIAKLDPLLLQAAVEQARALLLTAQSTLQKDQVQAANLELTYDRYNQLRTTQVISQADFDTAQANYNVASAQVDADRSSLESARAALAQAETNLSYTTIVSPIDGIVISRNVDVGQTVAASFQAPTLFVIAPDLRRMQVDTNVSEADVGLLSPGLQASFMVDAYPGKPFVATLRQIRNAAQTVQNVVTYDAVLNVDNSNLLLRPGMTANVTFVVARKQDVVCIRNSALRFRPDSQLLQRIGAPALPAPPSLQEKMVWILRGGRPVPISITIGITDGTWTELMQGDVHPGDTLITDMTANKRRGLFP